MIELRIGNSVSHLIGLTVDQHKALKELLSYRLSNDEVHYGKGSYMGHKRTLLGRRGDFPTGLLYLVETFLKPLPHVVKDIRVRPKASLTLDPKFEHAPYPEQIDAACECDTEGRGVVVAPTGLGKSIIVALIIALIQVPTLVVVPTLELKRQTTEGLRKVFGEALVGGFGSKIAVENVDALSIKEKAPYDAVIIDEFHRSGAKTYRDLNKKAWDGIYFRFGLTATPFRSQDNERLLLESVLSKVVYRVEYQDAVKKGYIVPMEAYYVDLPKRAVDGYTWREVYKELVAENVYRNQLIATLLNSLAASETSALCLVKEIAHGEALRDLTGVPFANGQDGDAASHTRAFNSSNPPVLIGTTGVLGEGVDTKPAEFVIIAGLGKAKNAFMQQCGRGFRRFGSKESCKIIIFRDPSHKWTAAHFRAQIRYLKEEYGITPIKLDIS